MGGITQRLDAKRVLTPYFKLTSNEVQRHEALSKMPAHHIPSEVDSPRQIDQTLTGHLN